MLGWFNNFIDVGMSMIITDGPFPGWSCAANHTHMYHDDNFDSTFRQLTLQNRFYQVMKEKNVYVHSPDDYWYIGGNRDKYPYAEYSYTKPRYQDLTEARQLMYGTSYSVPPTAGWMFMPMVPYHGGPPYSTFEPLDEHLAAYDFGLGQYFSYAVAVTLRGYELFDNDATMAIVKKWVQFFKKHREVLTTPNLVHIRAPDNRNVDAILHTNPAPYTSDERGLLIVFNPNRQSNVTETLRFSTYYTGIRDKVKIVPNDNTKETISQSLDYGVWLTLEVNVPKWGISFYVLQQG
jgi:hypothetical protein